MQPNKILGSTRYVTALTFAVEVGVPAALHCPERQDPVLVVKPVHGLYAPVQS